MSIDVDWSVTVGGEMCFKSISSYKYKKRYKSIRRGGVGDFRESVIIKDSRRVVCSSEIFFFHLLRGASAGEVALHFTLHISRQLRVKNKQGMEASVSNHTISPSTSTRTSRYISLLISALNNLFPPRPLFSLSICIRIPGVASRLTLDLPRSYFVHSFVILRHLTRHPSARAASHRLSHAHDSQAGSLAQATVPRQASAGRYFLRTLGG